MLRMNEYVKAKSLEEACEILQKNKKNRILGGMLWLRQEDILIPVGIDISECGLDKIEETETEVKIGATVTLRELETNPVANGIYNGILGQSVQDIVGVQFRNTATVGGSIFSRFGFSDILTAMLALNADVVLYKKGRISLAEFVNLPYEKDILTHIIIKKEKGTARYLSERRSATDFPLLAVAVSYIGENWNISVGARPSKAELLTLSVPLDFSEEDLENAKEKVISRFNFGTNMRAGKEYRELLAKTFTERAMKEIKKEIKEECRC